MGRWLRAARCPSPSRLGADERAQPPATAGPHGGARRGDTRCRPVLPPSSGTGVSSAAAAKPAVSRQRRRTVQPVSRPTRRRRSRSSAPPPYGRRQPAALLGRRASSPASTYATVDLPTEHTCRSCHRWRRRSRRPAEQTGRREKADKAAAARGEAAPQGRGQQAAHRSPGQAAPGPGRPVVGDQGGVPAVDRVRVMCVVAVFLVFSIMSASGLWDSVNETIQDVRQPAGQRRVRHQGLRRDEPGHGHHDADLGHRRGASSPRWRRSARSSTTWPPRCSAASRSRWPRTSS